MRKCKQSWLDSYLDCSSEVEAPVEFNLWAGISAISGALGRSCWVGGSERMTIYPNQYIVLVAPSGVRKSAAAEFMWDYIMKDVITDRSMAVKGQVTVQKMLQDLGDHQEKTTYANCFIFASEYKVFTDAASSTSNLLPVMTDLWGCPPDYSYKTKNKGEVELDKPCFNMMGCSTPEWLSISGGKDFILSGFVSRNLYIYKDEFIKRVTWPKDPDDWITKKQNLIDDLRSMQENISGLYTYSDEANEAMDVWYQNVDNFQNSDIRLAGFQARKQQHVIKLSMVLAASESDRMVIEKSHHNNAVKLVAQAERWMSTALSAVGFHEYGEHAQRIIDQIERAGKVSFTRLLHTNWRRIKTDAEMTTILITLEKAGVIKKKIGAKSTAYYMINTDADNEDEIIKGGSNE